MGRTEAAGAWSRITRSRIARIVLRLVAVDARQTVSLGLWAARRRHGVPAGAVAVPYAAAGNTMLYVLLFAMAVETFALEALIRGTGGPASLSAASLALHVWAALAVVMVAAAHATRPHVVTGEHVRVRHGAFLDVVIPRAVIAEVRHVPVWDAPDGVRFDDGSLGVAVSARTNVVLTLTEPVEVGRPLGGTARVSAVRLYADEPRAALAALAR